MPDRHALTIQLMPGTVGHAAVTLTDPSGQTYAGFGPSWHKMPTSPPQFDVHTVPPGTTSLPSDYSNVFGDTGYRTFTLPITAEQANSAHAEIGRIANEKDLYNVLSSDPRVCTSIVDRIMRAAGVNAGLSLFPQVEFDRFSDIAETLAKDPKARVTNLNERQFSIPEALRGLQPDYAYVGAGYDTPSERVRRVRPGVDDGGQRDQAAPFADRFGSWLASPVGTVPAAGETEEPLARAGRPLRPEDMRRLTRMPPVDR